MPGRGQAKFLRDMDGDFALQVRVSGDFTAEELAGIILVDRKQTVGAWKLAVPEREGLRGYLLVKVPPRAYAFDGWGRVDLARPVYIRLDRRGDRLTLKWSVDAKEWFPHDRFPVQDVDLARKLKMGLVAEATAPGTFKAEFDAFKLTPLGEAIRPLGGKAR
jgi:regulation of enolase protein 1 (concanavalin A-like superfamily)